MAMSSDDVHRKVESTWSDAAERHRARQALDAMQGVSDAGRARVQLAVLKLADGRIEELGKWIEVAERDFRDTLAPAEYPEEFQATWALRRDLSEEDKARVAAIRSRDRAQYLEWLKR